MLIGVQTLLIDDQFQVTMSSLAIMLCLCIPENNNQFPVPTQRQNIKVWLIVEVT